ncbi:mannose-P-dolichol utilization defect 1 protein-like [Periophthalmus magnuspinnatus]|uniref:mannose-P-dolichol utilization defect 1 protein-like n=1 Tax=Periophthalmus magnuspinnatus TaxID=409849 RepID=UPI00145A5E03|nr:mannose-P-dolichol utilization defect 1 protein-like [Periophthalmus magnuspinnatus]
MTTPTVKDVLVTFFMSEKCYEDFFVNFLVHVSCLKMVLSKVAGFWILFDVLLAQLLQLLTVLWRGRADGLSLTSVLLQLYAFSCPILFAVRHNFPLEAWAERLFLLIQTAAIVLLMLRYQGNTLHGVMLLLSHCALIFLLITYAASSLISKMQDTILPAIILSKLIQTRANYCNEHTGQLSSPSLILSLGGALGKSLNYWDSYVIVESLLHTVSACLSFALVIQMFYYRRHRTKMNKNE